MKYVYVTYDPLYEEIVCVHDKPNLECKKCKKLRKKREKITEYYFLEEFKRKLQP